LFFVGCDSEALHLFTATTDTRVFVCLVTHITLFLSFSLSLASLSVLRTWQDVGFACFERVGVFEEVFTQQFLLGKFGLFQFFVRRTAGSFHSPTMLPLL